MRDPFHLRGRNRTVTVTFSLALPGSVVGGGGAGCLENSVVEEEDDDEDGVAGRTEMLDGGGGVFRERKGEMEERRVAEVEDIWSHGPAVFAARRLPKYKCGTFEMVF